MQETAGSEAEKSSEMSAEESLQRLLSATAQLPCSSRIANDDVDGLVDGIWKVLTMSQCGRSNALHLCSEEERNDEWESGLVRVSALLEHLSPTELHSTVSSCIVLADGEEENSSMSTIRQGSDIYYLTCILLCCIALQKCPNIIQNRWKRWQSMQLETIRLYQLYTPGLIKLWCDYVLPATFTVQQALTTSYTTTITVPQLMAYPAVAVHCTTKWLIDHIMENEAKLDVLFLQTMWSALDRLVLRGYYEILYEHPLRKQFCRDVVTRKQHDDEEIITETKTLAMYTLLDRKEDNDNELETLTVSVKMETVWSDWGIAVIAATAGWYARPLVWSPWYVWRLFRPHVDMLLLFDNEANNANADSSSRSISRRLKAFAYQLLENLLQILPDALMAIRASDASDRVIGTCQLLANQILERSLEEQNKSVTCSVVLPNSAKSFQLLRNIVLRYRPIDQFRIIRGLIEDCPHPSLRPKLVDVLRCSIRWNDTLAEHRMWQYFDSTFLAALDGHIDWNCTSLINVNDLIDNCEMYSAVFGIMQLFIVNKRYALFESIADVRVRLDRIHKVLQSCSQEWASQSPSLSFSPPSNYYRINLLESILSQLIERLSVDS